MEWWCGILVTPPNSLQGLEQLQLHLINLRGIAPDALIALNVTHRASFYPCSEGWF